jgi:hypothetical protein
MSHVSEYNRIQSEYATYNELKETVDTLKPLRPPTAPADDIAKERKGILHADGRSLLFIQVVLVLVILVMLTYMFIPVDYSHYIAFLLVSVGIAVGFFLMK